MLGATRAEAVAAQFGVPIATDDYRDFLASGVDAVVIATPPALHEPMALAAIRAGKHVLCEKPLAATLDAARAMRDAAQAAGVVHMVNHQTRYGAPIARASELIANGYLGRATVTDIHLIINPVDYLQSPGGSSSKATWYTDERQAGGLLFSAAGPHFIDAIHALVSPIVEVAVRTAVTRPELGPAREASSAVVAAEDAFLVMARCADGTLATMRGTPVAYHAYTYTIEIHGTVGSLLIQPRSLHGATVTDKGLTEIVLPDDALPEQIACTTRFIKAIRAGGPAPTPTFADGVATQAVLAACAQAARSGNWISVEL